MRELESTSWWNEGMRDIARDLLERVSLPQAGSVLDAGCGSGQTMRWFLEHHPKWEAVGIDISPDAVNAANASGLDAHQASVLDIPLAAGAVDLIISLDVLQHLPLNGGDQRAAEEFRRVLKPGGILLVRTNAQSIPRVAPDAAAEFRKYDVQTLQSVLRGAGFEIVTIGRCNAVLGLAEIPRELRAARTHESEYHGILAEPGRRSSIDALKRGWLRFEGRAMAAGFPLPLGRTIFALAKSPA
jgi:SAM-dependent methyltransferase